MPPEEQRQELGAFFVLDVRRYGPRMSHSPKASTAAEPLDCGVRSWRSWLGSA